MSDVKAVNVGLIRPIVTVHLPVDQELEPRVPPPDLEWDAAASPAVAAPPVAAVPAVATEQPRRHSARSRVSPGRVAPTLAVRSARHTYTAQVALVVLATVIGWLGSVTGPATTLLVSLGGVWVATTGRERLVQPGLPSVTVVLRQLGLVYAIVGLTVALGISQPADLRESLRLLSAIAVIIIGTNVVHHIGTRGRSVVVVGDRAAISRAAMRWSNGPVHVVGGILSGNGDTDDPTAPIVGVPTMSGLHHVERWARECRADMVVVSPGPALSSMDVRRMAWNLERSGIGLAVVDGIGDAAPHRMAPTSLAGSTFLNLRASRPAAVHQALKGAMDRVLGAVLLALFAPLIGLMVLAVRLDSCGRGFFKQVRVGQDGENFTMFKMRTMCVEAETTLASLVQQNEGSGPLFKMKDDPRITRVGKLLRRTSLDELPQLINVVRGEMSLVGPRPALPAEVAEYDDVELRRLAVRPGMTGLWQVSGRSNLSWESSMALDLHYADNWRVTDDLLIGVRTVGAVAKARGAY
jgi:exopolysaccharide biosynthesis polyprenyl glycosylphosphotransferase